MTELPEGWAECRLSEITQVNPPLDRCPYPETGLVHFVPMPAVEAETGQMDISATRPYPEVKKGYTAFVAGDVLFAKITPCMENGKMAVVPELPLSVACGSTEFHVLRPRSGIVAEYVYHFVSAKAFRYEAEHNMTGAVGQKRVPTGFIGEHTVPLPPTAEQHRIAAKIEALFSELDAGQDSLTRAQAQLKLYRQSLLKAAFQGRLTADWRAANPDKLESPETLLPHIRTERDARYKQALDDWQQALAEWRAGGEVGRKPAKPSRPADIPNEGEIVDLHETGWATIPMGLVIDDPAYGTSKKCNYPPNGLGVLRIPNIAKGVIDATDLKYAEFDEAEREAYRLDAGDLLTIRSNGSVSLVGKTALIGEAQTGFLYAGYLIRLRPNKRVIDPRFLLRAMESHVLRSQIEGKAKSTSGVNNINSGELCELAIPVCSIEEQCKVVEILEERLSSVDAIETEITAALAKITALRQSILKQAFSGRLVPQDPADEPASTLLARLRDTTPVPRTRRKTPA